MRIILLTVFISLDMCASTVVRPSSRRYPVDQPTQMIVVVEKFTHPDQYEEQDQIKMSPKEHRMLEKKFYDRKAKPKAHAWRIHTDIIGGKKEFAKKYVTVEGYENFRELIKDILQKRKNRRNA